MINQRNSTYAKLDHMAFLCPPWWVFRIIADEVFSQKRRSSIFLGIWVACQWLLFLSSGSNLLVNYISANFSIVVFFCSNFYFLVDMKILSQHDQRLLRMLPLRILVFVTTMNMMYFVMTLPGEIVRTYEKINIKLPWDTFLWNQFHFFSGIFLILVFFLFILADKYEVFERFPRTNQRRGFYGGIQLLDVNLGKLIAIYFVHIVVNVILFASSDYPFYEFINQYLSSIMRL